VDIWVLELSDVLAPADRLLLDESERTRADRFLSPVHGIQFTAARAAAKRIVASYLGVVAGQVNLGRRRCPRCGSPEHGPPIISAPENDLKFSLSRSRAVAAVAVSTGAAVGVDIESTLRVVDIGMLARGSLSAREFDVVMAHATKQDRWAAFLRCWTRKEAILKGVGVGVATNLPDLDVKPHIADHAVVSGPPGLGPSEWQVHDLDIRRAAHLMDAQEVAGLPAFVSVAHPHPESLPVMFRWWGEA
jgi:4'-phosphopantetheinyl transferase